MKNKKFDDNEEILNAFDLSKAKTRMKLFLSILLTYSSITYADVPWDIPIENLNKFTDNLYLVNLNTGDTEMIDKHAIFCTDDDGNLAISGTTKVGDGEIMLKVLPDKKVSLLVPDTNDFLKDLINNEAYASCQLWTAHEGEYIYTIERVNNKTSVSSLKEKP